MQFTKLFQNVFFKSHFPFCDIFLFTLTPKEVVFHRNSNFCPKNMYLSMTNRDFSDLEKYIYM